MKLKTSKYILKEEESKRIIIEPDVYINYLKTVSGNGDVLKNVKKFRDNEIYINGDLDLSNSNVISLGPVDYINGKLIITNSKISDIGDVEVRDGIVGGDYVTLKSYVKTSNEELLNYLVSNSNIVYDYITKESPLETEIKLEMDDETFYKMCGLSDDDIWFLNIVFSPYSDYDFFDKDSADNDFKEGYIYHYFDEDNIKKMIDIMETIAPELNIKTEENLVDNSQDVYEKMESYFKQETDNISYEYSSERNSSTHKAVIDETEKELTDVFSDYGLVEKRLFNSYHITVGDLMRLYEEYGKNISIFKLFKIIADKELSLPYFQDLAYQVTYDSEFNETGFNSVVYSQLDKILEKIEDGFVDDMVEYKKVLEDIKKRYEFNTFYELPKDSQKPKSERRLFKINKIDLSTNEIEVRIHNPKTNETITNHYSLEDFNLLLHHPELFESKKNKYIITESKLQEVALSWMNKNFHPDKLEIVTSKKYPYSIFYRKDGKVVMEKDSKYDYFLFDYYKIWLTFERAFNMENDETIDLLRFWLEENLKVKNYTPNGLRPENEMSWEKLSN